MLATQYFKKRSYTFRGFTRDVIMLLRKSSRIRDSMKSGRISTQFRERIMLAVTAVNGCVYCEWAHTKVALEQGCTNEEIKEIMAHDFGSCDPYEVVGLAFAQRYAETEGLPPEEAYQKLFSHYGEEKANDIILFIKIITIGNLLGNTFDAFESRLRGLPPEKGSFFFEFYIYILGFPFFKWFKRKSKKKIEEQ